MPKCRLSFLVTTFDRPARLLGAGKHWQQLYKAGVIMFSKCWLLFARAQHMVADNRFVSWAQCQWKTSETFLVSVRCVTMFVAFCQRKGNVVRHNVAATMCPRFVGVNPVYFYYTRRSFQLGVGLVVYSFVWLFLCLLVYFPRIRTQPFTWPRQMATQAWSRACCRWGSRKSWWTATIRLYWTSPSRWRRKMSPQP